MMYGRNYKCIQNCSYLVNMNGRHHLRDLRVDGRWGVSDKTYFGRIFFKGEIFRHSSHRALPQNSSTTTTTASSSSSIPCINVITNDDDDDNNNNNNNNRASYRESTKSRNYKKQPYLALHTYFGKC